eukprot:5696282-Pleurochrysis_carterae.AAC.2
MERQLHVKRCARAGRLGGEPVVLLPVVLEKVDQKCAPVRQREDTVHRGDVPAYGRAALELLQVELCGVARGRLDGHLGGVEARKCGRDARRHLLGEVEVRRQGGEKGARSFGEQRRGERAWDALMERCHPDARASLELVVGELRRRESGEGSSRVDALGPVSYTHLTLPTILLV